jgi:HEAT repeat protein
MDLTDLRDTPPWEWPGDAGRLIRKSLNNRNADPAERLLAADFAGDLTVLDNDLSNVLLAVLRNKEEPEELRAEAAIAFGPVLEMAFIEYDEELGEFDDEDAVPISVGQFHTIQDALRRVYNDPATPKLIRRRVLEASIRAPEPWHQDAVRTAYTSGDAEWMLTAVFAMREVPGFENETLEALNSTDPKIQFEAVVAAGEKDLDAAWPHLFNLAKDDGTEKNLRIAAIEAIGTNRPEGADKLLTELADSEDEDIATAADEALSADDLFEEEEEDDEDDDGEEDDEDEKRGPS